MSVPSYWLCSEHGRVRLGAAGLVLGRWPRADVVLEHEKASRRHALIYIDHDGPHLVQLGRGRTTVNGEVVDHGRALAAGDTIEVPGRTLTVTLEDAGDGAAPRHGSWVLRLPDGALFGVSHTPFAIGGGTDDLHIEGWPPGAIVFSSTRGGLLVEACVEGVSLDERPLDEGELRRVGIGSQLSLGERVLKVVTGGVLSDATTQQTRTEQEPQLRAIVLEYLPRGGRLHVTLDDESVSIYLPDRRCDLLAVLLKPPDPLAPGALVSDEIVIRGVWGRAAKSRSDVNVLVHRLRKDLARAGVDGVALIQRAEGGGATRFVVDEGTLVTVG